MIRLMGIYQRDLRYGYTLLATMFYIYCVTKPHAYKMAVPLNTYKMQ